MRILAAICLSVTGAVTAFLAVLSALDEPRHVLVELPSLERVMAFAAPELAVSSVAIAESDDRLGSVTRFAAPPVLAEANPVLRQSPVPVRTAQVPPIKRRRPAEAAEPVEAPTRQAVTIETILAGTTPPPPTARSGKSFDGFTRSALGGPRPSPSSGPAKAAGSPK